jgi:hypothetical protein
MQYCYDDPTVFWDTAPFVIEQWPDCASGSESAYANAIGQVTISCENGGSVLYYGTINPNYPDASGRDPECQTFALRDYGTNNIIQNVVGNPVWGIVVDAPEGVTCNDFSGLVILFDHGSNTTTLARYTNGDLTAGDLPTALASIGGIPNNINEIVLNNGYKSLGTPITEVFINGDTSEYLEYTPATGVVGHTVGLGFFWVNTGVNDSITLSWDDNTATILVFNQ